MNLDCSRILGSEFLPKLLRLPFKMHPDDTSSQFVGGHFASASVSGSYGTVIIVSWLFIALNGYDEEFYPWGFQDTDLLLRLKTQGKVHVISDPDSVGDDIPNAEGAYKDHIKAKMTSIDYDKYGNMKWGNMDQKNRADGQEKLRRGQAVRNYKKIIGGSVVQVLCTDMPEEDDDEDTGEVDWSEEGPNIDWDQTVSYQQCMMNSILSFRKKPMAKYRPAWSLIDRKQLEGRFSELLSAPLPAGSSVDLKPRSPLLPLPPPPPPPSVPSFQVLAFGLETLPACYQCDAIAQELADHSWKSGHHFQPYKEDVVDALASANFPRADVVLDCRVLYEHQSTLRASSSWGHNGDHPQNGARIVRHRNFVNLMRDAKKQIASVQSSSGDCRLFLQARARPVSRLWPAFDALFKQARVVRRIPRHLSVYVAPFAFLRSPLQRVLFHQLRQLEGVQGESLGDMAGGGIGHDGKTSWRHDGKTSWRMRRHMTMITTTASMQVFF